VGRLRKQRTIDRAQRAVPVVSMNAFRHRSYASGPSALVGLMLIAGLVAVADFLTDERLSFQVLFVPIAGAVAWFYGIAAGLGFALATAFITVLDDYATDTPPDIVTYGAAGVRFLVFACMAALLGRLKRSAESHRYLAAHDALTGLANRQQLFIRGQAELDRARREGARVGAMFVDCDHFKAINDRWGHATGDELLCEVADSLRAVCEEQQLLARLGGDEFVVIAGEAGAANIRQLAERLQAHFSGRMQAREYPLSLSIGVALFDRPPATLDEVIAVVDDLMYAVKHDRKNGIQFRQFEQGTSVRGQASGVVTSALAPDA